MPASLLTPPKPTRPVPAPAVCSLSDVAAFKPGKWNGGDYTPQFLKALHDNFQKFSSGPNPYYRPFITVNHSDAFRFGHVPAARMSADGVLHLDAADMPIPVGEWVNGKNLTDPSIEFWEPVRDPSGRIVAGFVGPDGKFVDGPVLKCLTLLGNDAPAVKGLPPLPAAKFHHTGRVRRFGTVNMDRNAILAALTAAGIDVSTVTDAVPTEFLQAILTFAQAQNGGATGTPPSSPDSLPPAQMADAVAPAVTLPNLPGAGVSGGVQPSALTIKFADNASATALGSYLSGLVTQVNTLAARTAATDRRSADQHTAAKLAAVRKFADDLATGPEARLYPHQKDGVVALLMKCDDVAVRKFADGKTTGTELAERMAEIAAWPVVKKFGEQMPAAPIPGTTGGTGPVLRIDPERLRRVLGGSPVGQAALARLTSNN